MSNPRNIYFLRHGQTLANITGSVQGPDSVLSQEGINQAKQVAKRLLNIDFETVVTSNCDRAIKTGQEIASVSNVPLVENEYLREFLRPSRIFNRLNSDTEVLEIIKQTSENWSVPNWRIEDGDNFEDTLKRAKAALHYIAHETTGDLVVVTHGAFLRFLINYVFTQSSDPQVYWSMFFEKRIVYSNTGITHALYDDKHGWRFVSINDSTHLS